MLDYQQEEDQLNYVDRDCHSNSEGGAASPRTLFSEISRNLCASRQRPLLTLQWHYVLVLVNYDNCDSTFWPQCVNRYSGDNLSCNEDILKRGFLSLYSDFALEENANTSHASWLIEHQVYELVLYSEEPLVNDLICSIHRDSKMCVQFLDAIRKNKFKFTEMHMIGSLIKCVQPIHDNQSGDLICLIIYQLFDYCKYLPCFGQSLSSIVCQRLENLLAKTQSQTKQQISSHNVTQCIEIMTTKRKLYPQVYSLLLKLRDMISETTDPLTVQHPLVTVMKVNHIQVIENFGLDWYKDFVLDCCINSTKDYDVTVKLLRILDADDIEIILTNKQCSVQTLTECLTHCTTVCSFTRVCHVAFHNLLSSAVDRLGSRPFGGIALPSSYDVGAIVSCTLAYLAGYRSDTCRENKCRDVFRFTCYAIEILQSTKHHNSRTIGQSFDLLTACLLQTTVTDEWIVSALVHCVYDICDTVFHFNAPQTTTDIDPLQRAMDEMLTLMNYFLLNQPLLTKDFQNIHNTVASLARVQHLNVGLRCPTAFQENLTVVEVTQDAEVLMDFIRRFHCIGWVDRIQFEETWVTLLGLLNPDPEQENYECAVFATNAVSSLLLQSILRPHQGNPITSSYLHVSRFKKLPFFNTKVGKKYNSLRLSIEKKLVNNMQGKTNNEDDDIFTTNIERILNFDKYYYDQIHITPLVDIKCGPTTVDVDSCIQLLFDLYRRVLSCPNADDPQRYPIMLTNATLRSLTLLTDILTSVEQHTAVRDMLYEFAEKSRLRGVANSSSSSSSGVGGTTVGGISAIAGVGTSSAGEDSLCEQYLVYALCRSTAATGGFNDKDFAQKNDNLLKLIDCCISSSNLPSVIAAVHGCLSLVQVDVDDDLRSAVCKLLVDFILQFQSGSKRPMEIAKVWWITIFHMYEHASSFVIDTEISENLMMWAKNSAVKTAPFNIYILVLRGFERLLLCQNSCLNATQYEYVVKLAVDGISDKYTNKSLVGLSLLLTCVYIEKDKDKWSPTHKGSVEGGAALTFEDNIDPDSLIVAMERVTIIFEQLKKGTLTQATAIASILPEFLCDFFPTTNIMNKVIGDFLCVQHCYPELMASVLFQVFDRLQKDDKQNIVVEWVMLSLTNFTQFKPISTSLWNFSCLFISASTNKYMKNLFSFIQKRSGAVRDQIDDNVLFTATVNFYKELRNSDRESQFKNAFREVRTLHTIYDAIYERCHQASNVSECQ